MHSQLCTHKTLLRTDTSTLLRLDNLSRRAAGNALAPWQLCTRFWLLRTCYTELSIYLSVSLCVIGLSMAAPHLLHGAVYLSVCLSVCYRSIYGCSTLAPRSNPIDHQDAAGPVSW